MKRLLPLIFLALLAPGVAEAQRGGDRGDRREARMERSPDRGAHRGPPGAQPGHFRELGPRGPRFEHRDGRFEVAQGRRDRDRGFRPEQGRPPGQARRSRAGKPIPPGQSRRPDRRFDDNRHFDRGPSRRGGFSRGHILPPEYRRARMDDLARHRLRRPPPGYSYHLGGRNAYLVSDRTGMIFEVVPLER